ncbi:MAG: recombinase family protein [Streptococcaceae bacterium]|nr:recombinase family protein [Streptococcaceae bacterium]MCL2680882.1 recombinase family protein [Streptococcaceae bacterium]MCL2858078.1 recombinase family protein [Streptococcaceae bacterium]
MRIGYARVSTITQDLDTQIEMLKKAGAEKIFSDKYTGTKNDRPEFDKMRKLLRFGDELIVTKLDRFSRSVVQGAALIDELLAEDIAVNILAFGKLDNTPSGKLMRNIFLSFAEFERDMIVERTQEGKAYAKAHNPNYKEGRPKRTITDRHKKAYEFLQSHSYKETEEMTGLSQSTLQRIKRQIESEENGETNNKHSKTA